MSVGGPAHAAGSGPRQRLNRTVVGLGLVSFFTDAASEMVLPLLPFFLTTVVASPATVLGLIEGAADAVAGLLKLYAGRLSDRLGRRKPLVLLGYGLSSAARPFLALAGGAGHVLAVRVVDRIGKGVRSSPRDALLSTSTPEEHHGFAFGFHRAMDHAGAVVGPLVALGLLGALSLDDTVLELRVVFAATLIPGVLAVIALALLVREPPPPPTVPAVDEGPRARLASPSRAELRLLGPLFLFALGNASDVVLLLKVAGSDDALMRAPLLWIALHVVKSVTSPLGGWLADRYGPRRILAIGWLWYALVYGALAFAESGTTLAVLFAVYGLFHGLTEAPQRALVASLSVAARRGTAFGWYHLTLAAAALPAGLGFGAVWDAFGPKVALLASGALAMVAIVLLLALARSSSAAGEGEEEREVGRST